MPRLLLMLSVLLTYPHGLARELRHDPRHPFADPVFAAALRVGDAVRERFALAAETVACHVPDNTYGYDLLLSRFTSEQQLPIRLAARDGSAEGARRTSARTMLPSALPGSGVANCGQALQRLRAADDGLVVLAERAASAGAGAP